MKMCIHGDVSCYHSITRSDTRDSIMHKTSHGQPNHLVVLKHYKRMLCCALSVWNFMQLDKTSVLMNAVFPIIMCILEQVNITT